MLASSDEKLRIENRRAVVLFGFGGSTYALLHEDTELALILDLDELLAAIGRVGDVQLLAKRISENKFSII